MAGKGRASGLRRVSQTRKILRRAAPEITQEVKEEIEAAAILMMRAAKANVDDRSGALSEGIDYQVSRDGFSAKVGINPGPGKKRAKRRAALFYALYHHNGTHAHNITAPDGGIMAILGKIIGTEAQHPGTKSNPFLSDAFFEHRQMAIKKIGGAVSHAMKRISHG